MTHRFSLLLSLAALHLAACHSGKPPASLQQQIADTLAQHAGVFAVAFKDLASGQELLINAHESFHAASTMKVPVMVEVFKQAKAGKFSLSDSVLIKNEFKSIVDSSSFQLHPEDDSEQELYTHIGERWPLSSLVYDMIIMSSNLATNIIMEMVTGRQVTQTMRQMGAKDIQVLRGVEDSKAFEKGVNNTTTAYDLMLIFTAIAEAKTIDTPAANQMIKILLDQKFNDIIPARLPQGVTVAHKTGEITGVRHDAGIVFLPDGRKYVLVLLSKQLQDTAGGVQAMAAVSEMIYKRVAEGK
ncbi:serine hydrolase [Chitinophaga agrisoli]|uniref:beta-lactamase n=1 Tax=Chitinophaga agrisoli TaxID=2607653 RepID=A0A5B2VRL5_9BACT|nr:serine hydrolase [Chitinophaga agrisoli]KAA2240789.1 serine hydrolase [Chitinophaga agrisoli]